MSSANIPAGQAGSMEYIHKRNGKIVSRGKQYIDWINYTHVIQKKGFTSTERVYNPEGVLVKTITRRSVFILWGNIMEFLLRKRY